MTKRRIQFTLFILLIIISIGCTPINNLLHPATQTPTVTLTPTATLTPLPTLTPTPPPSVAIVNGIYVWQEDFDTALANLRRAYEATGSQMPTDAALREEALENGISEALFESAAYQNGFTVSDAELDERVQSLADEIGGADKLREWQAQNNYSESGFRRALKREIAIAKMREKIFADQLTNVEQIHAYQILTNTREEVIAIKNKLDMGMNFIQLAGNNDTLTRGDMDWIARGILVYPELENALFALEPGTYTGIIETEIGFHLLYAAEKSTDRPLTAQSRQILEHKALADWLANARATADITLLNQ